MGDALAILTHWNFKFQSFAFMFCAILVITWIQCYFQQKFRSDAPQIKNSTEYYCENFNTILLDDYTMIGVQCSPITCVGGVSGARV